jgi:hypothetical protein
VLRRHRPESANATCKRISTTATYPGGSGSSMGSPHREHDEQCDAEQPGDVMTDLRLLVLVVGATDSVASPVPGNWVVDVRSR